MTFRSSRVGALIVLGIACANGTPVTALGQGREQVARSSSGMIVSAHPLATLAGQRILERGGNAADAAVAAAFAIAVVEPAMNGIGGRNQILVRHADGKVFGIDGTTQVPQGYDTLTAPRASSGYATVGVPGAVAGLIRLHKEHGSLTLEEVMASAIDYAENGFRLLPIQSRMHAGSVAAFAVSAGARAAYLRPDGTPPRAGDLLRQPDLARTLRTIASGGHDAFYRGDIARTIAADMAANAGYVTLQSLADYRAEDSRVVRGTYRGFDLVGLDVPASGSIVIQALQIMERFDRARYSETQWAAIVGQAIGLAIPDLVRLGADSTASRATSKAWAITQAAKVRLVAVGANGGIPDTEGHTTHLSVADSSGMVVSLTQTLGPTFGSAVATPGLGFLYAATMGGYLGGGQGPGVRARSGIAPLIVTKDGAPVLVLGAAGGIRIISAVVQAVSRVVDDNLPLPLALAAPRVHPELDSTSVFAGLSIETEPGPGWTRAQAAAIDSMGIRTRPQPQPGQFGRVHAIRFHKATGEWEGAADPDGEGMASSPERPRAGGRGAPPPASPRIP